MNKDEYPIDPDGYLSDADLRITGQHLDYDVRLCMALTEAHMRVGQSRDGSIPRREVHLIGIHWSLPGEQNLVADLLSHVSPA